VIRGFGRSIIHPEYDDGGEDTYILINRCFHIPFNDTVSLTLSQRVNS